MLAGGIQASTATRAAGDGGQLSNRKQSARTRASQEDAPATCVRVIVPAGIALHIGPNKSEREPTSGRSKHYGPGHRVPAFRGIERKFS